MSRSTNHPGLHRFAMLTALATLALIGIGGLVTSHEAGLAVPDWPTSYGYNMFLFPFPKWWRVGNVFYEHSHRLFASGVGLLTIILVVWVWRADKRRWLRWLTLGALLAVVLQGVLGGLRVVLLKNQIGIFHATLAQLFFALTCAIALFTSRWWIDFRFPNSNFQLATANLRRLLFFTTGLILFQLVLGATMRHQHAGLSISDFPLAHGTLWPATDAASVAHYNAQRMESTGVNPITAFQILLQMAHRVVAVFVLIAVAICTWFAGRRLGWRNPLSKTSLAWLGLILVQACLGAATVLTNKAADVATAHVLIGALSLATGVLLCIICARSLKPAPAAAPVSMSDAAESASNDWRANAAAAR